MSDRTTTTVYQGLLSPGPFKTEEEALSRDDIPEGFLGKHGGFSVYLSPVDDKWWRVFWSTTTLLEHASDEFKKAAGIE